MFDWFNRVTQVGKMIGRSFRDWSEWAQREPHAAADQLDGIATVFKHRAKAYRRQTGWRARRDRGFEAALREHADALRENAPRPAELQRLCGVKPGAFKTAGA